MTCSKANVDTFNVDIGPIECCARRHAFELFTGENAWSKANIRAAIHRVWNARDLDGA